MNQMTIINIKSNFIFSSLAAPCVPGGARTNRAARASLTRVNEELECRFTNADTTQVTEYDDARCAGETDLNRQQAQEVLKQNIETNFNGEINHAHVENTDPTPETGSGFADGDHTCDDQAHMGSTEINTLDEAIVHVPVSDGGSSEWD